MVPIFQEPLKSQKYFFHKYLGVSLQCQIVKTTTTIGIANYFIYQNTMNKIKEISR